MEGHVYLRYLAAWSPMYLLPLCMLSSGLVERVVTVTNLAAAHATCGFSLSMLA